MKVAVFSTKPYDKASLDAANAVRHELVFFESRLTLQTAPLAANFEAVCVFVNDELDAPVLAALAKQGVRLIVLRCAGFNNVDVAAAAASGLKITRVPAYSPCAVAEHAVSLMLCLNRKLHRAYARVRDGNFALEGLLGFDFCGKTAGIIGTGKIGRLVCQIMQGLGCTVLAYDMIRDTACESRGVRYTPLEELLSKADVISLHCPLTAKTRHLIHNDTIKLMKDNVMLINTSRGALIHTQHILDALKSGKIGYLGLDVYEQEEDLFFEDLSSQIIQDDLFERLLTLPNVMITGHQGFFTEEALRNIAMTTLENIDNFVQGQITNEVSRETADKK